jgi:hypothetical protein
MDWFTLPKNDYHPSFLKALAMAVHRNKLTPTELDYFFENKWTQLEIAKELYKRVKNDT